MILSILLAGKRTLEFYAKQLITGKTKKEDQEKVLDVLLEVCKKRDDILGDTVMVRLQGAPSDLHAADARY